MMEGAQFSLLFGAVVLFCSAGAQFNFCKVELNSFGLNDDEKLWTSWIKVNGATAFTATYNAATNANRGINTVELDPHTCATSNQKSFDSCGGNGGADIAAYIKGLKAGTIVVVVTTDEPSQALGAGNAALTGLGFKLAGLAYRGKFQGIAVAGTSSKTFSRLSAPGGANLYSYVLVNSASNNLRIQPACLLDINAYGLDDANNAHTSWIKVNGATVFTQTWNLASTDRGIHTVELDPNTCAVSNSKSFDTYAAGAAPLAAYITGLKAGTVLVVTTSDEPQQNIGGASAALTSLGINVAGLTYRGKFVVVAQVGQKAKTISAVSPSGGDNLHKKVYVKVPVDGVRFERICQIDLNAYGLNDANNAHTSWIKVEGATIFTDIYSTSDRSKRGVSTAVLTASTCATSDVKSFDTCGSPAAATALTAYLKGLASGTVLLSVTSDEAQQNSAGAVAALTNIPLDLSAAKFNYRSKFVLATQFPFKDSTLSEVEPSGGNNVHRLIEIHDTGVESIVAAA